MRVPERARTFCIILAALWLVPACSDDGDSSSGGSAASSSNPNDPDLDLSGLGFDLSGGTALGRSGAGGTGGRWRGSSADSLEFGSTAAPPAAPPVAPPPAGGTVLNASQLASDVALAGHVVISGDLTTSGPGAVRRIASTNGDLLITGTLRAQDLGTSMQGLLLEAPLGTVHILGTVDGRSRDGVADGDPGASVEIPRARDVVISGTIVTRGEYHASGTGGGGGAISISVQGGSIHVAEGSLLAVGGGGAVRGGDGGALELRADDAVLGFGTLVAKGGSAWGSGADLRGGAGGNVVLGASTVHVAGVLNARGGSAQTSSSGARGGAGGVFALSADEARIHGTIDLRGGTAQAAGSGTLEAGAGGEASLTAGTLRIGEGPHRAAGGPGDASGGGGGLFDLYCSSGDLDIGGTVSAEGGASVEAPGAGGRLAAQCDIHGGSIRLSGIVELRGGSASDASFSAPGGAGGSVHFEANNESDPSQLRGSVLLEPASRITLDGGAATGSGSGGAGGLARIVLPHAKVSLGGQLQARGGAGSPTAGTGGRGGGLHAVTDNNADGVGGDITVEVGAVVDVSGGAGAVGGDARNDFPHQPSTDPETTAIVLDSDSVFLPADGGIIRNLGIMIARGGAAGGSGGSVTFHGKGATGPDSNPVSGTLQLEGDGGGSDGEFYSD